MTASPKIPLFCALAAVAIGAWESSAAEPEEFAKLQASYQAKLEEVLGVSRKALMAKLTEVEKQLAGAGEVEQALIVREERVRLSLDSNLSAAVIDNPSSPELSKIAELYNRSLDLKVAPIDKTYVEALGRMQKEFAGAGRLDDAVVVKTERENVAARVEGRRARTEKTTAPIGPASPEMRLTNSVWQLATDAKFTGPARYFTLQSGGEAYYWGFSGKWEIDKDGGKLTLEAPSWGKPVELELTPELKAGKGVYRKDASPRFARRVAAGPTR